MWADKKSDLCSLLIHGVCMENLHRAKHYCPQDRLSSQSEQLFPCLDLIMPQTQKGLSVSKAVLKKPFPLRGFTQILPFSSSSSSSFLKLPTCHPSDHFLLTRKFNIPLCSSDQRLTIWSKEQVRFFIAG